MTRNRMKLAIAAPFVAGGLMLTAAPVMAQEARDCEIPIGAVLSLSGSLAAIGGAIGDSGQLAIDHMNAAGGLLGCDAVYRLRDDQGQPSVGVDAAKSLVEIEGVEVILGAIQSGITMPVLTSVSVPEGVVQISCCSSAPSFTALAVEGGTNGYWFRTLPTVRPQGHVTAALGRERGYTRTAVIYVNSDYGLSIANAFAEAVAANGGAVTAMIPYNQEQASYRAEVTQALRDDPDSLFLVAFPADGATALREWLSLGGSQNLLLSNALRASEFVEAVGARFLTTAVGLDNAQVAGPSVDAFNASWAAQYGEPPAGPGLHTMYDAAAVALLATQAAGTYEGSAIRDMIRQITGPGGEIVNPGVEGFTRAHEILAAGGRITYVGATGPISFDENGDVTGPYLVWGVDDTGTLTQVDTWSNERVAELMAGAN
jgi:ABC-type branched-subunit amino acid transport system substrate-binding protein